MNTPIYDFVRLYGERGAVRFHMPGHKGQPFLGCEHLDLTEIPGADSLYEADGIIAASEAGCAALFGARRTLYSTEGSSQCIRAMLHLVLQNRPTGSEAVIVAARNVHRAFLSAAALLDVRVEWLWPGEHSPLCSCPITPQQLERTLNSLSTPPAAVYLTSPDYLGGMADLPALAEVCHRYGTLLAVDNAHGAYLRFLSPSLHPLDLGADLCCDSAHKTLPVLTGGAWLHISRLAPPGLETGARASMALFGSTSPSYLTLSSLDLCCDYLSGDYPARLAETTARLDRLRARLAEAGWKTEHSDPLRLTLRAPAGCTGTEQAARLRECGIECEYADRDHLVLMITPENDPADLEHLEAALGKNTAPTPLPTPLPAPRGQQAMSIRDAMLAQQEVVPAAEALGRICGAPTVSCPPAVPVSVCGEIITAEAIAVMAYYGIDSVSVVKGR